MMAAMSDELKALYSSLWEAARDAHAAVKPGDIVISTLRGSPFEGCLVVVKSVHDYGVKGHVTIPNADRGPQRYGLKLRHIDFSMTGGWLPLSGGAQQPVHQSTGAKPALASALKGEPLQIPNSQPCSGDET